MKLPDSFVALARVRESMGAGTSAWSPKAADLGPRADLQRRLVDGIEIELDEVQSVGALKLLTYRGEQVLLYIRDTRATREQLLHEPETTRRYHVAECSTLEEMRRAGRFERYVVAQDTSGLFLCDWRTETGDIGGQEKAALKVCKNCLKELNWNGYPSGNKAQIWGGFDISEFLFEHATLFYSRPSRSATSTILDQYPANWAEISMQVRQRSAWTCKDCGVNLQDYRHLLHCHHVNGVRGDSASKNLEAVCMICHSEKPMHTHMKVPAANRAQIQKLRKSQGIR